MLQQHYALDFGDQKKNACLASVVTEKRFLLMHLKVTVKPTNDVAQTTKGPFQ